MAGQSIAQPQIGAPTLQQATGHAAAQNGKTGRTGQFAKASNAVVSTQTLHNPDGSTTTVTNYANGTQSTTTTTAAPARSVPRLLSPSNSGQLATLLSAQEQANRAASGKAA
jgi:hypothetical protein